VKAERKPLPPLVIAHRGAHGGQARRENKLPAFARALAMGVDAVECDVHLSADNVPVVIHDETLDRTTTAAGPVSARTALGLRRLGVPSLRDLCRLVHGRSQLLVEIKSGNPRRVLDVIRAEKMERDVVVMSFHAEYLRTMARLRPRVELAFLLEEYNREVPDARAAIKLCHALDAAVFAPSAALCSCQLVTAVHRAGLRLFTWTVDTPPRMRAMMTRHVDGIITNYPDRLKARL
jgi:glycerophosphoryl diester phosphodiesterase